MRVGVASIMQETNTFSVAPCTLDDFTSQGLYEGEEILDCLVGTNTEIVGAVEALTDAGVEPVPLLRAWAMSSGPLTAGAFDALRGRLRDHLAAAGPLDGLVLSLHGAMVAEQADDADAALVRTAREVLAPRIPVGVCLDLHANVTCDLVDTSTFVTGYHTYPHIDMAETGARTATLLCDLLAGRRRPVTALAKRPLLIPAEMNHMTGGPMGALRDAADAAQRDGVLDVALFPVQPWLDVPELGFGALATVDGDRRRAREVAERFAEEVWARREAFRPDLVAPIDALERVRAADRHPVLLSESADSPTAGATADSPAMLRALLDHGRDLEAYATLVDAPAVEVCVRAGKGATVALTLGCSLDRRFHKPVSLEGTVITVGDGAVRLTGLVFTGMVVQMGRCAVVRHGRLSVLVTERPAFTADPATFETVGLDPQAADVVVVRSANLFRAGWRRVTDAALILDLPGASTPRLEQLPFERAPRPLYPLEVW